MEIEFRPKLALLAIALMLTGLFAATSARADELYGRIRGIITDSTGAVLTGAQVKITSPATGISQEQTSGADGSFLFVNLKPGIYELSVSKSGFKTFQAKGIQVIVNQVYVQNAQMEVGTVTETLEVQAHPVQVDTTSMQLSTTLPASTLVDAPLAGRNWIVLQQTLPGVVTPDTRFGTNFSTNGSQAQQNSYLVNGNDANDLPLNSPLVQPIPDAIAEVQMVTNSINPEFGRNSGAILNAITKSGTNNFHGNAFDFYRDTFLNTADFFHPKSPQIFHQNQFGGTVGGPILKNHTFFFFGYQGTRARQPSANFVGQDLPVVYTQAQFPRNGAATAQWDPTALSSNSIPAGLNIVGPNGPCASGTTTWAQCFVGGVVPTANFNPLSVNLVNQFVPLPNFGNEFSFQPIQSVSANQFIGRLDQTITSKDSIWFYTLFNDQITDDQIPFTGATVPGFGQNAVPATKQFTASWQHTFSPDILNELRLGYTRLNFKAVNPDNVVDPASVGFPTIHPQITSGQTYPTMGVVGYFTLGFSTNGPQPRKDQTYQITDNFSWIKGKHSMKIGYDGRKFQVWNPFGARNSGNFTFDASSATFTTGDSGLDFLLGIPASYNQQSGALIIAQAYEHYFYFQDQWRLRDNLTITLGTGYQIDTPIKELQYNGQSRVCFRPGEVSTLFPTAPAGYVFSSDPGCNAYGGATTKYGHFGPRIGFAYSPNWGRISGGPGKMSIRGGWGLYFNRGEEELNLQDLGNPPFGQATNGASDVAGGNPEFPDPFTDINGGGTVTNRFPFTPPAAGTPIDFSGFFPLIFNTINPNLTTPYAMNYNLTVERELPARMIMRVAYVGSQGRKNITSYSFNSTTPAGVQACINDPLNGTANGCVDNKLFQPLLFPDHTPFPGDIFAYSGQQSNGGNSNYNSLQFTVQKAASHGLTFLSAYTYSKALDISSSFEDTAFQLAGAFDPYGRLRRDYGNAAFDARHRWVMTFTYQVPDLHKTTGLSYLPTQIFGGWQITGINTLQSGQPVNLQDRAVNSLTCSWAVSFYACPDRPDFVGPLTILDPRDSSTNHLYFDKAGFAHPALGQLGNVRRGFLVGPGYQNFDFSLQKDTHITEDKLVQLRLEIFNLFNHTNFANPNGDRGSSQFGRISALRRNATPRQIQLGAKFVF